jgi:hypothetical protein
VTTVTTVTTVVLAAPVAPVRAVALSGRRAHLTTLPSGRRQGRGAVDGTPCEASGALHTGN